MSCNTKILKSEFLDKTQFLKMICHSNADENKLNQRKHVFAENVFVYKTNNRFVFFKECHKQTMTKCNAILKNKNSQNRFDKNR